MHRERHTQHASTHTEREREKHNQASATQHNTKRETHTDNTAHAHRESETAHAIAQHTITIIIIRQIFDKTNVL